MLASDVVVEPAYIPALRFRPLTHWYDFIIKATIREHTFKSKLVDQTALQPGERALDLGCGTGTLTLMLKQRYPQAHISAIDADIQILSIARTKAAGANIDFHQAMSFALPFPDQSFDCIASSLMFHHLTPENKLRTLREVHRVLKPAGRLHIADFGPPKNALQRAAFFGVQVFDGFASTSDSVGGALPRLISEAGFTTSTETAVFSTLFGTIRLLRASR